MELMIANQFLDPTAQKAYIVCGTHPSGPRSDLTRKIHKSHSTHDMV